MEKEYVEKLERMDARELLQLRVYVDAVKREVTSCSADRYTDAPAAAPPEAADHNPG